MCDNDRHCNVGTRTADDDKVKEGDARRAENGEEALEPQENGQEDEPHQAHCTEEVNDTLKGNGHTNETCTLGAENQARVALSCVGDEELDALRARQNKQIDKGTSVIRQANNKKAVNLLHEGRQGCGSLR